MDFALRASVMCLLLICDHGNSGLLLELLGLLARPRSKSLTRLIPLKYWRRDENSEYQSKKSLRMSEQVSGILESINHFLRRYVKPEGIDKSNL